MRLGIRSESLSPEDTPRVRYAACSGAGRRRRYVHLAPLAPSLWLIAAAGTPGESSLGIIVTGRQSRGQSGRSPRPGRNGVSGRVACTARRAQRSALAGSTKRSAVRDSVPPPSLRREPCRPRRGAADRVVWGWPSWAMIHSMTAAKSTPSARIAARSMTTPPEACGRANRVTNVLISASSTLTP